MQQKLYNFYPIPDWFWFGHRAIFKPDLRSGITATVDPAFWLDWKEATDNEEFTEPLERYVQSRFYSWTASDVRASRNKAILPQFIYKQFALKFVGKKYVYEYTNKATEYTDGVSHFWSYTPITSTGKYQFANYARTTPTIQDDILPLLEI